MRKFSIIGVSYKAEFNNIKFPLTMKLFLIYQLLISKLISYKAEFNNIKSSLTMRNLSFMSKNIHSKVEIIYIYIFFSLN